MAQISYINYKDILEACRYDAEYFKPEYLKLDRDIIKFGFKTFESYIELLTDYTSNGSFASLNQNVTVSDKEGYAKWIRINDLDKNDFSNCRYVNESGYLFLKKTKLFGGELLISKTGEYLGKAYINPSLKDRSTLADNIFLIKLKDDTQKEFIKTYINSHFGQSYIKRLSQGVGQPTIIKDSLRKIKIPNYSDSFKKSICEISKKMDQKQIESRQLYSEAENILLEELGLINYHIKNILNFSTTKKEIDEVKRFDSEYFQPKYKEIIEKIEKYQAGCDCICEIVEWKKGIEVGTDLYSEKGKDFIRVSDFSKFGIIESNRKIPEDKFNELKINYQPKIGEIIFTKDGTIGTSYVIKENIEGILSGAFLRLSLKEKHKNFEKECLSLIFNSIICKMQVEKLSGGALIAHLKPSDFEKFKIPLIKPEIQKEIVQKIQESHKLRKESKELLEEAKRKVEEEIENI